jgi:hypothetical protein
VQQCELFSQTIATVSYHFITLAKVGVHHTMAPQAHLCNVPQWRYIYDFLAPYVTVVLGHHTYDSCVQALFHVKLSDGQPWLRSATYASRRVST